MVKRVDVAAYETLMDAKNGQFTPGVRNLGLAENGVDWAVDENNAPILTDEIRAAVENAKKRIIAGVIEVHDYMATGSCPH
jgi:basic membrane protein A